MSRFEKEQKKSRFGERCGVTAYEKSRREGGVLTFFGSKNDSAPDLLSHQILHGP